MAGICLESCLLPSPSSGTRAHPYALPAPVVMFLHLKLNQEHAQTENIFFFPTHANQACGPSPRVIPLVQLWVQRRMKQQAAVKTVDGNAWLYIGLHFDDHRTAAQDTGGKATISTISKMICFSLAEK